MANKALTVAIAGALAAPMAAQAVDFTISGHVNRALFLVDTEDGSKKTSIQDNGGSSTRIRATGSTEIEGGNTVSIQLEYQATDKGSGDDANAGLGLRHANVQYGGGFGKITIGQGSEAGDSSQYSDTTGVFGIGHGAGTSTDFGLSKYFGSLEGGSREEMIRYDTPSLGGFSLAASLANGDRVSGQIAYSGEFGGSTFGAKLATLQMPGDTSTIGASFGATMASGFTFSGAWAKSENDGAMEATEAKVEVVDESCIPADMAAMAGSVGSEAYNKAYAAANKKQVEAGQHCRSSTFEHEIDKDGNRQIKRDDDGMAIPSTWLLTTEAQPAKPGTDPSYWQAEIGYKFGNTGIAASWYQSKDFVAEGSKGRALGIGARHTLPKANAEIYIAMQNYDVKKTRGASSVDETVYVVGSRVKF